MTHAKKGWWRQKAVGLQIKKFCPHRSPQNCPLCVAMYNGRERESYRTHVVSAYCTCIIVQTRVNRVQGWRYVLGGTTAHYNDKVPWYNYLNNAVVLCLKQLISIPRNRNNRLISLSFDNPPPYLCTFYTFALKWTRMNFSHVQGMLSWHILNI